MTNEEALTLWLPIIVDGVKDLPECKEALDMAIQALSALNEINNVVDSAEMIIEEQYGVVIVEGYYDVFELIKKKVRNKE